MKTQGWTQTHIRYHKEGSHAWGTFGVLVVLQQFTGGTLIERNGTINGGEVRFRIGQLSNHVAGGEKKGFGG